MNSMTVKKIESPAHPETKKIFWILFASTRGAGNRKKIMSLLKNRPSNPNQISTNVKIDYKCTSHHLRTLEEHHLVDKLENNGMTTFFPSTLFEENELLFNEIIAKA